jgi:hypothetical protein
MVFNKSFYKYFNITYNFILNVLKNIDKSKTIIYIIMLIFYYFLYYSINIPQNSKDPNNNGLVKVGEQIHDKQWALILSDSLFIIGMIIGIVFYFLNFEKITNNIQMNILFPSMIVLNVAVYLNVLTYSRELTVISDSIIAKYIFLGYSIIFYSIIVLLFLYNINNLVNIELIMVLILCSLFLIDYILSSTSSINQIYYQLKNNNYEKLSLNCFNDYTSRLHKDHFNNGVNNNNNIQLLNISKKYGDNYLKTIGNIPVSFLNKKSNDYQDLVLADFYFPGSYYSYIAESPLVGGTPSLDILKTVLTQFKARIIHLDVYSDKKDPYDPNAEPIIKCAKMSQEGVPLNFIEVLGIINKWAWVNDDPNNSSYPLFLYLQFHFEYNESLYIKIYDYLLKMFSKYFIDKKYSFSGRNGTFSIANATMKECIGKIIIVTNLFPTKTALDELINTSTNTLNKYFNVEEYKESYIKFSDVGVSQDHKKDDLVNNSKFNISLFYTKPNEKYVNPSQIKSGLYNPSFQDCAQYGIQGTLMYLFLPDDNLNKWYMFFLNKNNMNPVLKEEVLRNVKDKNVPIEPQNPVTGIQKPQKYCVVPGLISTEKSNISGNPTNETC